MKIIDDFVKRLRAQQGMALSVSSHSAVVDRFVSACLSTEDASGHKHGDDGKFTGDAGGGGAKEKKAKKTDHNYLAMMKRVQDGEASEGDIATLKGYVTNPASDEKVRRMASRVLREAGHSGSESGFAKAMRDSAK